MASGWVSGPWSGLLCFAVWRVLACGQLSPISKADFPGVSPESGSQFCRRENKLIPGKVYFFRNIKDSCCFCGLQGCPPPCHPQSGRAPDPWDLGKTLSSTLPSQPPLSLPTSSTSAGILHLGLAPGNFWKHQMVRTDCFHYDYSVFNLLAQCHQELGALS